MRKMPSFLSVIQSKIPRHFSQVLATLAVSLGPFSAGLGKGYSSPALASLQESKTSTFHVTAQEGSWVASLSLLGAMFGCLFGGLMLQIGRKRSLLIIAIPFAGSWLLTVFAQRVEMMYSTSFIGGFFSAVILLTSQVYVSEIAHPEIRGCLSAVLKMAGEIGTLCSFTLGAFLDWRQLATVAAGAPILFFFAILLIPETPSFLLFHGKEEEATRSLAWLRSSDEDVSEEISTLRNNIMTKCKSFFPRCSSGQFPFRPLFITCGLMFFQKFSGVTVFHHYAVPIFKQVFGRSLHPHGAAIVVVLLRLLGSMTSGLLIDTAGRLPLLILSNLFISGSFFGFGLYNWMEESLPPSYPGFGPSLDWIPLTCVLFFTLFFSIGIGPISWLMVGELFPLEYRGFGGAVSTSFSYACAFAAVKTYVDIRASVGLYGAFWIYSAISVAGLFFVCCLVPETKGVELEEMEHHQNATTKPPPTCTTTTSPPPPPTNPSRRKQLHLNLTLSSSKKSKAKQAQIKLEKISQQKQPQNSSSTSGQVLSPHFPSSNPPHFKIMENRNQCSIPNSYPHKYHHRQESPPYHKPLMHPNNQPYPFHHQQQIHMNKNPNDSYNNPEYQQHPHPPPPLHHQYTPMPYQHTYLDKYSLYHRRSRSDPVGFEFFDHHHPTNYQPLNQTPHQELSAVPQFDFDFYKYVEKPESEFDDDLELSAVVRDPLEFYEEKVRRPARLHPQRPVNAQPQSDFGDFGLDWVTDPNMTGFRAGKASMV